MSPELNIPAEELHAIFYLEPPVEWTVERGHILSVPESGAKLTLNREGSAGALLVQIAGKEQALAVEVETKPEVSGTLYMSVKNTSGRVESGEVDVELYMTDPACIRITS